MKILFLHGWHSVPGGVKPTYLKDAGHGVINPALDDDDFEAAVETAQAEYDQHMPDVIVGHGRGGAVAMNISSNFTPQVLLCPSWTSCGSVNWLKANSCIIHSVSDSEQPVADSYQLIRQSGLPQSHLCLSGTDNLLEDENTLSIMRTVCEGIVSVPAVKDSGLIDFYTSQANLLVNQFDDINKLLGWTTDHTGPGTHCESLVRDLLRRLLPNSFCVDKGFVYGHRLLNGRQRHCPEIDILVHDVSNYRPIFQVDDFVIVQPEAVRGVIQVKRSLTSGELKKAIKNVVEAKRHVQDCFTATTLPGYFHSRELFGGLFFFEDRIQSPRSRKVSKSYQTRVRDAIERTSDRWTIPHVIHCLNGHTLVKRPKSDDAPGEELRVYRSIDNGKNLGLQGFLAEMSRVLLTEENQRRFRFPNEWRAIGSVELDFDFDSQG